MIQVVNVEHITCESCGEEHDSQVIAFPKSKKFLDKTIQLVEYYHTCPNNKIFFQTEKDINETFKLENAIKKQMTSI